MGSHPASTSSGHPSSRGSSRTTLSSSHGMRDPTGAPPNAQGTELRDWFAAQLDKLEAATKKARVHQAQEERRQSPGAIFKDLRRPVPVPVQFLLSRAQGTVVEVNETTAEIRVIRREPRPEPFRPAKLLNTPVGPKVVTEVHQRTLKLEDSQGVNVGDPVRQDSFTGSLQEMFDAFANEWKQRWSRHADTPPQAWAEVMEFARRATRPTVPDLSPINLIVWKAAISKKKPRTATGPDGWSRKDLTQWPDEGHRMLLDVIHQIEAGAEWPAQLTHGQGHIFSLEKAPNAQKVSQYRPITALALIYRVWRSFRARQLLAAMATSAPDGIFGSMPRRSAKALWWNAQATIERAHMLSSTASGAVVDLVKCFNLLPRVPLLETARWLG